MNTHQGSPGHVNLESSFTAQATATLLSKVARKLNVPGMPLKWRVLTKHEVKMNGWFDPPCATLQGRWGPIEIRMDIEGYLYVDDQANVPRLNMADTPKQIADAIINTISEWP